MDVYQKVLLKVYEMTGGKDTEDVNFSELLKREGFYPSLPSILEHLSNQSWITETSQKNVVRITHWGAIEAKKLQTTSPGDARTVGREVNHLLSETREMIGLLEDLMADTSKENLTKVEKKITELNSAIIKLKTNIR